MGAFPSFKKKRAILIGPLAIFLKHWACPQLKNLFGPQLKE
jgi:hypothetical protein